MKNEAMISLSVVIITRNEADNLAACIRTAALVSDDIVVVDSGSLDDTPELALKAGARVVRTAWESYAASRNRGARAARHDWVLSLDADERVTRELASSIRAIRRPDPGAVYGFRRVNFFAGKRIRFGDWGRDKVFRLYNRRQTGWNLVPVHETLVASRDSRRLLEGPLHHFTVRHPDDYRRKARLYALLSARGRIQLDKKPGFLVERTLAPLFNFTVCYFLRLGLLDGKEGWIIARDTAYYTWLKNHLHRALRRRGPGSFPGRGYSSRLWTSRASGSSASLHNS